MKLSLLFLALPLVAVAQTCDSLVIDQSGLFNSLNTSKIEQAAPVKQLINQGADFHVLIFPAIGDSLKLTYESFRHTCPDWSAGDGGVKNTLLVFAVAPGQHKTGIYYGSAWKHAIDPVYTSVMSDDMNPRFRDKDFAGGIIQGAEHISKRIDASRDERQAGIHVINQATDYSGFYTFLMWLLFIGAATGTCIGAILLIRRRREHLEAVSSAQQAATTEKNKAAAKLVSISQKLKEYIALSKPNSERIQFLYDNASETFSRLSGSIKLDPSQDGLSAAEYNNIKAQYAEVNNSLTEAESLLANNGAAFESGNASVPPRPFLKPERKHKKPRDFNAEEHFSKPRYAQPAPPVYSAPTTVVVNNNSNDSGFVNGILAAEILESHESRHESHYEAPSHSSWGSSDSSSSSGGDSSWGSSSSSDSGSSSDWGSSDSGSSGGDSSW